MTRKSASLGFTLGEELVLPEAVGEPRELLSTLFKSSTVGVAICDRQLRFRAINDALASMNGIPASAHIGKTLQEILGAAAAKVQPAFEHVFATGEPLCNFEVTAKLPERAETGRWNEHYFPLKDRVDQVRHVGAVVLELPRRKELKTVLFRLNNSLNALGSILHCLGSTLEAEATGYAVGRRETAERSRKMLEACLRHVRHLSVLLQTAPKLQALEPAQRKGPDAGPSASRFAVRTPEDPADFMDLLSSREREVIALLASGRTNKEIGAMLSISARTVETHRSKIMLKLHLESLSDVVRGAFYKRLLQSV